MYLFQEETFNAAQTEETTAVDVAETSTSMSWLESVLESGLVIFNHQRINYAFYFIVTKVAEIIVNNEA